MENMTHEARELALYLENEYGYYPTLERIAANMARHYIRGDYNLSLSIKGYRHLVDTAAKQYHLEHGSMTTKWSDVFTKKDRDQVAEYLALGFSTDVRGYICRGSEDLSEAARKVIDKARARGWEPVWFPKGRAK